MKPVLGNAFYKFCIENADALESMIDRNLDWQYDIFSVETQIRGYLTKVNDDKGGSRIAETPQYKNMRIAAYLWYEADPSLKEMSLQKINQMYRDLSEGRISPASPTQFNAGMKRPQLASCFLLNVEDTINSLSKSWHDSSIISMTNGGLGIVYDSIRHSEIGNNGWSKGIVPWIKIENEVLSTIDQCFHPDTIVYTVKDGPKRIAEIGPGEKLIRSDGLVSRVRQPISYEVKSDGRYYNLYVKHYTKPVIVSDCHPILCINNQHKGITHATILKRLESQKVVIEYTPVEEITDSSFIGIPIPVYEKDLPRYSKDDCRMYGILLGDGSFSKKGNEAAVYLGEAAKTKTAEFVRHYLNENGLHFWESVAKNTISIRWTRKHHLFPFTREMLYDDNDEKHFYPSFLHLPVEKLEQIFLGLMESDGCYKPDSGEVSIELSALQVIESLRYILLRMKIHTSGYCRDRIGNVSYLTRGDTITTRKLTEVIRVPKTKRVCELLDKTDISPFVSFFEYDGKLWTRVTKKELIPAADINFTTVHDLEMEIKPKLDSEITANYATCIGSAHNGGRRKGSGCMFLTDWHTDILEFIDLKEPFGKEELRAKDLFYGLMISDLFMNRVKNNEMWTLFCPAKAGGLEKKYGREFEKSYLELERKVVEEGLHLSGTKRVMARDIWTHILNSQINTGMPFKVYKDAVNRKSNQQHMGTLRTSNLCVEINEYVDKDNIASCNLASIPLSKFVKLKDENHPDVWFDFDEFGAVVRRTIRNLGQTINRNYYAEDVPQIKYCNMRNRPLGIGVQDLAGCFAMMDICWDSQEAKDLNEKIFRTMYFHGMDENVIMAEEFGAYETFPGSPASKGLFQFNLWAIEKAEKMILEKHPDSTHSFNELLDIASNILLSPDELIDPPQVLLDSINSAIGYTNQQPLIISLIIQKLKEFFGKLPNDDFDWDALRHRMVSKGLYFSLLFAQMPTASSAQILGSNESIECYTQFLYSRTVLSGQFVIVVDHLVKDLEDIHLWNTNMLKHLLESQGSIQEYPTENMEDSQRIRFEYLKKKYRTAFEHSQRTFSDLYLDRAKYQCQSSSNNVFMKSPTLTSLNAYHFHMWQGGAKTGMYYLRQMVKSVPLNFSLESIQTGNRKDTLETAPVEDDIECLVCQS